MAEVKDKLVTVESLDYVFDSLQANINSTNTALKKEINDKNSSLASELRGEIQNVNNSLLDEIANISGSFECLVPDITSSDNGKILGVVDGALAYIDKPASDEIKKVTGSGNISVTVEDNTEYRYTDVTSLSITCPDGEFECWIKASFSSGISFSVTNGTPCHSNYDLAGDTGGGDADYSGTVLEIHIKDGWYTLIVDDLGTYTGK